MAITLNSVGTVVAGTNTTITPAAPASIATGDALLVFTWEFLGSQTVPTPAGYSALDANINAKQVRCFGTPALGNGLDVMPSFTWGAGSIARAFACSFSGVDAALTADFAPGDRTSNTTSDIVGPASLRTPASPGSLVLLYGTKNKTSTSNATTFSAPGSFTNGILLQDIRSGSSTAFACAYWIQTAATTIAANTALSGSVADGSSQAMQGSLISLLAAALQPPGMQCL
jgi:hypothetical protein